MKCDRLLVTMFKMGSLLHTGSELETLGKPEWFIGQRSEDVKMMGYKDWTVLTDL